MYTDTFENKEFNVRAQILFPFRNRSCLLVWSIIDTAEHRFMYIVNSSRRTV